MPHIDCIVTTLAQSQWISREFGLLPGAFRIGSSVTWHSPVHQATFLALADTNAPRPVNMFGYHREEITPMNLP